MTGLDAGTVQSRLDASGEMTASQIAYVVGADVKRVVRALEELEYEARIPGDLFPNAPGSQLPYVYPSVAVSAVRARLGKR